jgi:hypothetical protein
VTYTLIGGEQFRTWETNENASNFYGRVVKVDPESITGYIPVICGHGGSMWLCASCAQVILCSPPPDEPPTEQPDFWRPTGECPEC